MSVDELIYAIEALIERHLKGGIIGVDEYSAISDAIMIYGGVDSDTYLTKYLTQDRYFLYDTMHQRYDNPSALLSEIEAYLDCKT
jgi:hypothetical protein